MIFFNAECESYHYDEFDVKIMLIVPIKLWINTYSVASGVTADGRLYGQVWRLITNQYGNFEEQGLINRIFIVVMILTMHLCMLAIHSHHLANQKPQLADTFSQINYCPVLSNCEVSMHDYWDREHRTNTSTPVFIYHKLCIDQCYHISQIFLMLCKLKGHITSFVVYQSRKLAFVC